MTNTDDWDKLPDSPNCVTIFGAGIAGLTAAHELVERGFRVQIWEPAGDQRKPQRGCEIGGLARTQWSRTDWPEERDLSNFDPGYPKSTAPAPPDCEPYGVRTQPIVHLPQKFAIDHRELDALSVRDPKGSYEAMDPYSLPPNVQTWQWHGIELSVRDWEHKSDPERKAFAAETKKALEIAFPKFRISAPFFDRSAQLWKIELTPPSSTNPPQPAAVRVLIFKGGFPKSIEQKRTPADVYGVLSFWSDDTTAANQIAGSTASAAQQRYEISQTLVLYQQWHPKDIRALGGWGSSDVTEVLQEIVDTLKANREIRFLYLEASDRDFEVLSDDERLARAKLVAEAIKKKLPPGVSIEEMSKSTQVTNPRGARESGPS